jgi:hypothetical protein
MLATIDTGSLFFCCFYLQTERGGDMVSLVDGESATDNGETR